MKKSQLFPLLALTASFSFIMPEFLCATPEASANCSTSVHEALKTQWLKAHNAESATVVPLMATIKALQEMPPKDLPTQQHKLIEQLHAETQAYLHARFVAQAMWSALPESVRNAEWSGFNAQFKKK